jgi:hypothetical protein
MRKTKKKRQSFIALINGQDEYKIYKVELSQHYKKCILMGPSGQIRLA